MLVGIHVYVEAFKDNVKRLKEMQDKAADRAAAGARSDMRANAAASAALRTAAYGFVSQTVAGDDTSDKADYELTDGLFPSDPEETKAVNMSKSGITVVDTWGVYLPVGAEVAKSDYIAKGDIAFEITSSVTDLLKAASPLKVTTVARKDYGSEYMRHTEVTAR